MDECRDIYYKEFEHIIIGSIHSMDWFEGGNKDGGNTDDVHIFCFGTRMDIVSSMRFNELKWKLRFGGKVTKQWEWIRPVCRWRLQRH